MSDDSTDFLSSFCLLLTGLAVPLLICLSPKTFATGETSKHFTVTVLFFLMSLQMCFLFERLFTLIAVECGEKWEVGMDTLDMQFQGSLISEGLLTLSTHPLLFVGERMCLFNMSLQFFHSFKLFAAMGAMVLFSWFLEWVLGWHLMDLALVSFEMLGRDGNLANATFSHHRYFLIAPLAPSVFYKLFEVGKLLQALFTGNSFPMSPQLMVPQ